MAILSIQSHVAFGYVGNKAVTYPLQSMGYDVWPVNTVQFSNHSGYGKLQGEIFSRNHVESVIRGIKDLGVVKDCQAIVSGYIGSSSIGDAIMDMVSDFKLENPTLQYLCDPVIGDRNIGVFVKEDVLNFYKRQLRADIITPNQFEAEILSNITIKNISDAKKVAEHFHCLGIKTVLITSLRTNELDENNIHVLFSDMQKSIIASSPYYDFEYPTTGTGDLFAALFLGHSLRNANSEEALRNTLYQMDLAVKSTYSKCSKELRVLDVDYKIYSNDSKVRILEV